jgi:hypothetical protein
MKKALSETVYIDLKYVNIYIHFKRYIKHAMKT